MPAAHKHSRKNISVLRPVEGLIRVVRGQKVMLDADLATLYGVTTGALNQAVKRNRERFPTDFMFQIIAKEAENLMSQSVISSWGGRRRSFPNAFTQEGVAMLGAGIANTNGLTN